jgi:hypothetical protein
MRIVITMRKSHLFVAMAVLVLCSSLMVYAAANKNKAWHTGEAVEVNIEGELMSLQEALDERKITVKRSLEADTATEADYALDADSVNGVKKNDFP